MEAKIIQVATNQHGFRGKFRTLLEVPGGDFKPLLPCPPCSLLSLPSPRL